MTAGSKETEPKQEPELLAVFAFRCTFKQREKVLRLGGSEWLRAQIDNAEGPK